MNLFEKQKVVEKYYQSIISKNLLSGGAKYIAINNENQCMIVPQGFIEHEKDVRIFYVRTVNGNILSELKY
jgi:hypothetical protein